MNFDFQPKAVYLRTNEPEMYRRIGDPLEEVEPVVRLPELSETLTLSDITQYFSAKNYEGYVTSSNKNWLYRSLDFTAEEEQDPYWYWKPSYATAFGALYGDWTLGIAATVDSTPEDEELTGVEELI